ncbi:uncharacterized protein [Malus domestica]|uniref:uncharacterized protein isoform X3 n=1 Tax=Malus domestica TaxID=3750 RepID=UPI0007EDE626|nr:uncharacterized protein LOC103420771 isoform X3 [Malus domestica]
MVEFVREAFEGGEIDMDHEFDAPKFFDFTRPETGLEAEEAEEWFLSGGYQPSPFLEKLLNWQKGIHPEPVKNSAEPKDVEEVEVIRCIDSNNCMEAEVSAVVDDNIRELPIHMAQDTPSAKPKSPGKSPPLSRSSTLMKPTASQLAKQKHRREVHSNRLLRRVAKKLGKLDEKSQNSPPPTKRQKLEAGYVAEQLKHQPLWLYKVPKKFFVVSCRSELMLPDLKLPFRRNQIWKQQIEHKDVGIRLMPNQENNQKFTGLLHGLARKRAQFQQQSFRCFAFQHQRELCNRHAIIT